MMRDAQAKREALMVQGAQQALMMREEQRAQRMRGEQVMREKEHAEEVLWKEEAQEREVRRAQWLAQSALRIERAILGQERETEQAQWVQEIDRATEQERTLALQWEKHQQALAALEMTSPSYYDTLEVTNINTYHCIMCDATIDEHIHVYRGY